MAATGGDEQLWDHLPYGPWPDREEFGSWLGERRASRDPWFHAVVPTDSGVASGMLALQRCDAANDVIEVGHIWFGPRLQRTTAATEALALVARHIFEDLGHRRLEWKCNAANARSRRAALRLGFRFEGIFRQHQVVKGHNRDTAWYSILDREWPAARAAYDAWLDPANFDAAGRQRQSLSALTSAARRQIDGEA